MNVPILMVTYAKDIEFAWASLRSIEKYATGFSGVKIIVPNPDVPAFKAIAGQAEVIGFDECPGKGMCHHMALICMADLFCNTADAILHLDADCLFTEPVSLEDYVIDGKPVLVRQRYSEFPEQRTRYSWKKCILAATGIDPEWETMCRHPSVHLPETYRRTRFLIERTTGQNFLAYILSCRNIYPQTFAEFPTLGAVAFAHYPERYHWIDWANCPPAKLKDFWSHGGMEMVNDRHPENTARECIERILGVPVPKLT